MNTLEIYFEDLTPDKQKELLVFYGYGDESEGNFEFQPLIILEYSAEGNNNV